MIWTLFLILVGLWLLGLIASIGGALIHLLLVIAIVVAIAGYVRRGTAA